LCGVWKDGIRRQKRNPLAKTRGLSLFQNQNLDCASVFV